MVSASVSGYIYACNSLTNFKFEVHAMTGNGSYVNFLKLAMKNKSHQMTLFLADFSHLEPLCATTAVSSDYRRAPGTGE